MQSDSSFPALGSPLWWMFASCSRRRCNACRISGPGTFDELEKACITFLRLDQTIPEELSSEWLDAACDFVIESMARYFTFTGVWPSTSSNRHWVVTLGKFCEVVSQEGHPYQDKYNQRCSEVWKELSDRVCGESDMLRFPY